MKSYHDIVSWNRLWPRPNYGHNPLFRKINYNIDDAIEEEAGEEDEEEEGGKISSPSTKSNSPKDNGDNDSVHSQDNHGLPTNDNAGSKKSGKISSSSFGAAVERDDLDLIELLKVKPKRVPELRTHDGFQKFFQGKILRISMFC